MTSHAELERRPEPHDSARRESSPSEREAGRLVVITPCRNEEAFLTEVIASVAAQTIRPTRWIIVDDGSSDGTPRLLEEAAGEHPFIEVVRRHDRGARHVGRGVVEAFNAALAGVVLDDYDFLCKLDGDLVLPPRYFETLIGAMESNPRLGSCSGKPYYRSTAGHLVAETCGDEMSIGASKFYRVECFREIGGFVEELLWDGIDCHRCRMRGWMVRSWDDPELRIVHLRPMGSSDRGLQRGRLRHGRGQYFMGTGLAFITASSIYRLGHRPYLFGGIWTWWGYVVAMVRRQPRFGDAEFRRFLRRYQWSALLRGKRRAIERLERAGAEIWHRHRHASEPREETPDG